MTYIWRNLIHLTLLLFNQNQFRLRSTIFFPEMCEHSVCLAEDTQENCSGWECYYHPSTVRCSGKIHTCTGAVILSKSPNTCILRNTFLWNPYLSHQTWWSKDPFVMDLRSWNMEESLWGLASPPTKCSVLEEVKVSEVP